MARLKTRYRFGHNAVVHRFAFRRAAKVPRDPESPTQHGYPRTSVAPPESATARHLRPAALPKDFAVAGKRFHKLGVLGLLGA